MGKRVGIRQLYLFEHLAGVGMVLARDAGLTDYLSPDKAARVGHHY